MTKTIKTVEEASAQNIATTLRSNNYEDNLYTTKEFINKIEEYTPTILFKKYIDITKSPSDMFKAPLPDIFVDDTVTSLSGFAQGNAYNSGIHDYYSWFPKFSGGKNVTTLGSMAIIEKYDGQNNLVKASDLFHNFTFENVATVTGLVSTYYVNTVDFSGLNFSNKLRKIDSLLGSHSDYPNVVGLESFDTSGVNYFSSALYAGGDIDISTWKNDNISHYDMYQYLSLFYSGATSRITSVDMRNMSFHDKRASYSAKLGLNSSNKLLIVKDKREKSALKTKSGNYFTNIKTVDEYEAPRLNSLSSEETETTITYQIPVDKTTIYTLDGITNNIVNIVNEISLDDGTTADTYYLQQGEDELDFFRTTAAGTYSLEFVFSSETNKNTFKNSYARLLYYHPKRFYNTKYNITIDIGQEYDSAYNAWIDTYAIQGVDPLYDYNIYGICNDVYNTAIYVNQIGGNNLVVQRGDNFQRMRIPRECISSSGDISVILTFSNQSTMNSYNTSHANHVQPYFEKLDAEDKAYQVQGKWYFRWHYTLERDAQYYDINFIDWTDILDEVSFFIIPADLYSQLAITGFNITIDPETGDANCVPGSGEEPGKIALRFDTEEERNAFLETDEFKEMYFEMGVE